MSTSLIVRDLSKAYASRPVLDGVDLTVTPGQRLGLIGENGAGKSTLVRIIAGLEDADGGHVESPPDLGYLAQDSGLRAHDTVEAVLAEALAPLHDAVERLEQLANGLPETTDAYAEQLEWVEMHDAWDADRRAEVAAHRLGLEQLSRTKLVGELSGGQRARLALAALLTRRPDCLVLDEPTNHLDHDALDFLESELLTMRGAVLIATHDRVLLERVCTSLVDLDPSHLGTDGRGGRAYSGSYSAYLAAKESSRRRWQEDFEAQQDTLNELRGKSRSGEQDVAHGRGPRDNDKFIHAFKGQNVQATVRRRVRDAEQRIATIERDLIPKPPAPVVFSGSFDGRRAGSVRVRNMVVPGRLSLERLDVGPGEHLLVTGPNGCGKSTLLKALVSTRGSLRSRCSTGVEGATGVEGCSSCVEGATGIEVATGVEGATGIEGSPGVEVAAQAPGYLAQEVAFADSSRSPLQIYADVTPLRPLADLGILHPRDLSRPVGELSQGQRQRLGLALLMATPHDLLLLDEPTNHISLALVEALEEALRRTPVTVIVASHDRWLTQQWTGPRLELR
ncbi:ABC-F family ATP-binding cassette domain-containing protein [Demetria terragena]|uniref:ABC-F family ATP-binding cassette domain-containing protein n=1 Tax=Demetria terragena TaxID=63959 RepID=UPI00037C10F9|nr:ABC-F family ATP-binding cassette domain-containing protein [Demetria terragena]